MSIFAAQYLEYYDARQHTPTSVHHHLNEAFARLPLEALCIGWDLPPAIVEACAEETARHGAALYRWHPVLSGCGEFIPRSEWQTVNAAGQAIQGFRGLPEFTFVCPNRPTVQSAILEHLQSSLSSGIYQGVFLDRIRFPSPAADPVCDLACFCPDCIRAAADEGYDLETERANLQNLEPTPSRCAAFVRSLLAEQNTSSPIATGEAAFHTFRRNSITRLVGQAAKLAREMGCQVGLDTFSPSLVHLVGQDLAALAVHCDWIKPMSYAHALGPSGLPFELLGLARWLTDRGLTEAEALRWLSQASGLPLPASLQELAVQGMPPEVLAAETQLALASGVRTVLAGIALVEMEGVNHVPPVLLPAEVQAYRAGGAAGLMLAWDLWHIPMERLEQIASLWDRAQPTSFEAN